MSFDNKIQHTMLQNIGGSGVIWANSESNPIIIKDGKIEFYDHYFGCGFCLYVKGTKGLGVADADKLVNLSDKHRYIIEVMKKALWSKYTAEQILKFAEHYYVGNGVFKLNPYKRTISELYRRKILNKSTDCPPFYSLNEDIANRCLESGKFED